MPLSWTEVRDDPVRRNEIRFLEPYPIFPVFWAIFQTEKTAELLMLCCDQAATTVQVATDRELYDA
jgi:hypothetical protein